MGLQLILIAGCFVAGANLCMRKNLDRGGRMSAYLAVQLFLTFLIAILLGPVRTADFSYSSEVAYMGIAGGLILAFMMASLGKALAIGPPGLTFAVLNSSTVMPAIFMALLFGASFGHPYTLWNALGSILVLGGLFWAAMTAMRKDPPSVVSGGAGVAVFEKKSLWLSFSGLAFSLHVLFLILLGWRALLINFPLSPGLYLSMDAAAAKSQWFMPMTFLTAALFQASSFWRAERRLPVLKELFFGILGGILNGVGTFFMILASEKALPWEHAVIFPAFSVSIILICNLWSQWLYKEQVNWKAGLLCATGLLIAALG